MKGLSIWSVVILAWGSYITSAQALEVDPELQKALRANSAKMISVVVNLEGQVDLKAFEKSNVAGDKGKVLSNLLSQFNDKSAAPILRGLQNLPKKDIAEVTPLWITNSLRIRATSEVIEKLMAMNGIESLMLDAPKDILEEMPSATELPSPEAPKIGWGVEKVRAPELWAQGITGKGITVAMMDSGANLTHPDLAANLWQNPGETGLDANGKDRATNGIDDDGNGYVDDVVGWNFEDKTNKPEDSGGHGSQTAGIVGGAGLGGTKTGVAPGVKLMILRTCCNTGTQVFESNAWEALQYAVKNGARVISMSLSVKPPSKPAYAKWRRVSEVILAANVVHINSAGNLGSKAAPNNIGAPATNPPAWYHAKQPVKGGLTSMITIGAVDKEDKIRSYSSTGPVTWEAIEEYKDFPYEKGDKPGLMKPDVCGPSETPSTSPTSNGYTVSFGGTSSATPHVAGVAALLLSAVPKLSVAQVTEALQMSAVKVGNEFNNQCGAGRVDAVAAVEYAKAKF